MMDKPTKIPPSEWEIMEVLWGESPLSAAEVFARMGAATSWSVKTVRAFLDRLLQKEAVSRRKIHGMYVFEPVVRRSDCLRLESRSFLDRFFQGNPISLIAHFLEEERLAEADVERLRRLLESSTGVPCGAGVPPARAEGVSPSRLAGILPASGEDDLSFSSVQANGTHNAGETPAPHAGETPALHAGKTPAPHAGKTPAPHAGKMPAPHAGETPAARGTPAPREGTP